MNQPCDPGVEKVTSVSSSQFEEYLLSRSDAAEVANQTRPAHLDVAEAMDEKTSSSHFDDVLSTGVSGSQSETPLIPNPEILLRSPIRGVLRAVSSITINDIEAFEKGLTSLREQLSPSSSRGRVIDEMGDTTLSVPVRSPSGCQRSSSLNQRAMPSLTGSQEDLIKPAPYSECEVPLAKDDSPRPATSAVRRPRRKSFDLLPNVPTRKSSDRSLMKNQDREGSDDEEKDNAEIEHLVQVLEAMKVRNLTQRMRQDRPGAPDMLQVNSMHERAKPASSTLIDKPDKESSEFPQRQDFVITLDDMERQRSEGGGKAKRRGSFDTLPTPPRRSIEGTFGVSITDSPQRRSSFDALPALPKRRISQLALDNQERVGANSSDNELDTDDETSTESILYPAPMRRQRSFDALPYLPRRRTQSSDSENSSWDLEHQDPQDPKLKDALEEAISRISKAASMAEPDFLPNLPLRMESTMSDVETTEHSESVSFVDRDVHARVLTRRLSCSSDMELTDNSESDFEIDLKGNIVSLSNMAAQIETEASLAEDDEEYHLPLARHRSFDQLPILPTREISFSDLDHAIEKDRETASSN